MGKLEDLKKHSSVIFVGIGQLIIILVLVIKGGEGVLDWGIGFLIGFGIFLTLYFTFGKLNKRYLNKRLKEKEGYEKTERYIYQSKRITTMGITTCFPCLDIFGNN